MKEINLAVYIATWMWHLTAVIFLCFSFVFFAIKYLPFFVAFIVVFAGCEFMALKRKKELTEDENEK